jgi:sugar/nucleoside kinase (ribokinase family)
MPYDIVTIGGATEDINFYVDDYHLLENKQSASDTKYLAFDYGTKIDVTKVIISFGGGAANTAVSLASLGLKTACLIACGNDDRGKRIIANLKSRGVNTSLVQIVKNQLSGFSFIVLGANNEHVAFSHRAANSQLLITKKQVKKLQKSSWLFVTSFSGAWQSDLDMIFKLSGHCSIAWNPGELQLKAGYNKLKSFLRQTTVLTFNKDEAIKLVVSHKDYKYQHYDFLVDSHNLLKVIKAWGPGIVVITNGEKGADAFDGQHYYHQDIIVAKRRADTTGLGDAFGSAFVAGLKLFNGDLKKSLRLAAHNSASVLSLQGAQNGLLKKSDLSKIFKK